MSDKLPSHFKNEYTDEYENNEYITPCDTHVVSNTEAPRIPQQTVQHIPQQTLQQGVWPTQYQLPQQRPRPMSQPKQWSMSHMQQRVQRCNRGNFPRNGDSKADTTCGNCGNMGHRLKHCMKQEWDGFIHGCPICNTTAHLYDECSSWKTKTQNRIQKEHLHYLVTMRNNRPPILTSVDIQTLPGFASSAFRPWTPAFSQVHLGFFLGHKYLARWDKESTIDDPKWREHVTVSDRAWSEHDTSPAPTAPVQGNPAEPSDPRYDNFEGFTRIALPFQSHREPGGAGTEVADPCFRRQIQSRTHSHPPDRSRHSNNSSVRSRRDIPEFPTQIQSGSVDGGTMFDHTSYQSGTSILNTQMFHPVPARDSYLGRYVAYSDVYGNRYLVEELGGSPKPNIHPASPFSLLPVGYVLPNSYPAVLPGPSICPTVTPRSGDSVYPPHSSFPSHPLKCTCQAPTETEVERTRSKRQRIEEPRGSDAQLESGSTHIGDAPPSRSNHTQSEREHTADLNDDMQTIQGSSAIGSHESYQVPSSKGAPHYRSRP
jgi:hypothetical protein